MDPMNPQLDLPERIEGFEKLAYNLWWSWHRSAYQLFRMRSPPAWRDSDRNPIRMLSMLPEETLEEAAQDEAFLEHYDAVMDNFNQEMRSEDGWFVEQCGRDSAPLAYFSAEYGLHASLPVYAGGLGVLAGDYLKECADLSVPIVAVGMIYAKSYVHQRLREDGWQKEVEETLDRTYNPISRVLDDDGNPIEVQVPALEPELYVSVWEVKVGQVRLYLLDPDLEINRPWDRTIASRLYVSDREQRLRQQILLGMGGMRVLDAMGIEPGAIHLNEGHSFLSVLERIRPHVADGASFNEALQEVRESTIFTTHTPVAAGTDVFPFNLMDRYLSGYLHELGTDRQTFLDLGTNPEDPDAGFNTTVFALRTSGFRNAVSERHGEVARSMWSHLWPDKEESETPIESITNGVHVRSWVSASRLQPLFDEYLGQSWNQKQDELETWEDIDEIPDDVLWEIHQDLKSDLLAEIGERARVQWHEEEAAAGKVITSGALLDREVLTLGFARRFTDYKRPDLILHDKDRFKALVTDPLHPVQVIFAGEAHPDDTRGKHLIQSVFQVSQDPAFAGRVAFVEDYDKELAAYMVSGVDIWLNNPVPALEASGTSGMKASVNGVPNLSILSGWWIEGYEGENGWAFGEKDRPRDEDRTAQDAEAIYRLLEEEIIPHYYERSDNSAPQGFVRVMKRAIKSVAPHFGTRRMLKEYVDAFYASALGLSE